MRLLERSLLLQQFHKFRHTKGFIRTWHYAVRFRDMITQAAQRRAKILTFWEHHGLEATLEAFDISRPTLFRWQQSLQKGGGKLEQLNKRSTAPHRKRKRVIPEAVKAFIVQERGREKLGKDKLAVMLKDEGIAALSASTVGRMLADLKKQNALPNPVKLSLNGRTGRLHERKPQKKRKKLRSKGHAGGLVKADTIVRFTNGIKRYIVTALDRESKFAFAYAYKNHSSRSTADFMRTFKHVSPLSVTHVQTDNGSEFADHFDLLLNKEGIVHFHSYPRCPKMQSEIERFNRTLSEAFIAQHRNLLAYNLEEFNRQLVDWLLWYNTKRPHWSLGLISPLRYICNQLPVRESQRYWTNTFV